MNSRHLVTVALIASIALSGAACSDDDSTDTSGSGDARTVQIEMADSAFEPDQLAVAEGGTVRFVFTNNGEVAHDAFIGDAGAQAEHEEQMGDDMGDMHHDHDSGAVTVQPGETGELTHTFDEVGTIEIGCHQGGHYSAGMRILVEVS